MLQRRAALGGRKKVVDWLRGVDGQNTVARGVAPLLPVAAATNPTNALERPPWPVLIPPTLLDHTPGEHQGYPNGRILRRVNQIVSIRRKIYLPA